METIDDVRDRMVANKKKIKDELDSLKCEKEGAFFGGFFSGIKEDIKNSKYYLRKYKKAIRALDRKDYEHVKKFLEKIISGNSFSLHLGSKRNVVNPDIKKAYKIVCKEAQLQVQ